MEILDFSKIKEDESLEIKIVLLKHDLINLKTAGFQREKTEKEILDKIQKVCMI